MNKLNKDTTRQLNNALSSRSHILVAVSGGADSVALLHLLHASTPSRRRLTVAHLNHGIRGVAARRDAEFVRALASRLRLPCVVGKARVPSLAKSRGISLEMAAREARYAFLARTARKVGADCIVTAHTADDQAETILLKLVRGTGRAGLSGISATTQIEGIPVIRPMLSMTKGEVVAYLEAGKRVWSEDASNLDTVFLRNRVRHELLPLLERHYNPRIRKSLLRTADVLGAEDEWMDALTAELLADVKGSGALSAERLMGYPLAARRRVVRSWMAEQGVPESCLDYDAVARVLAVLMQKKGSATVELACGWRVRRQYDRVSLLDPSAPVCPEHESGKGVALKIPGITAIPEWGISISTNLASGIVRERGGRPGRLPARATLNAQVRGRRAIRIRYCRPGDRIRPFGMKGSCKLQDILVDAKVPRSQRDRIPLLVCGDEVIWVPGYRIARGWAVEDGAMANLQVSMTLANDNPLVLDGGRG